MKDLYFWLATFLMVTIFLGGIRIARGPTRADRMLGTQFLTTASVAIFLLFAEVHESPALRSLSLTFVALATLTTVAFTQIYGKRKREKK